MSEDLAEYYSEVGVKCAYLHSEVSTLDRIKILRDLRRGNYDVLIGVNLAARRAWTCPKFRWSRFWMRTKKAFCDPAVR